jgi:hypothetical protein
MKDIWHSEMGRRAETFFYRYWLLTNGRNISKNPAPPSERLLSHCRKIRKIFKNNVFFIETLFLNFLVQK